MKMFLIFLVTVTSFSGTTLDQDNITIKATFDTYDDGVYSFTDENEKSIDFTGIEDQASEKYNLLEEGYTGKTFMVTYRVDTDVDESDEEFEIYIIMDLELIK